ncbi:NUDIX hydrolase [Roseivirga sp. BDSF3-8]|uniref:NUDIX hydrolase n=1 Tax=Roseivirga sp. BDSF3-8 TaxID=3241598 RepID=UPI00353182C7
MKDIGVWVANVQILRLTGDQEDFYKLTRHRHEEVWVVLSDSPVKGSVRDPFSIAVRSAMIREVFPEATVLSLKESPKAEDWSTRLESLLTERDAAGDFTLYGTTDTLTGRYTGSWKTEELNPELDSDNAEAAEGFSPELIQGEAFRKGIIYAYQQLYPQVYATVDIAVHRNEGSEWLIASKAYTQEWRLPGGFSDPEDAHFEEAAARELKEETGVECGALSYQMSMRVDDWRYRNERDKIITLLYTTPYVSGEASANDDIENLRWVSGEKLKELLQEDMIAAEHIPLFRHILEKFA